VSYGTRYVALYKRDFRRGLRTGGFHRALRFPPPSKLEKFLIARSWGVKREDLDREMKESGQKKKLKYD
jgi:hypothetical protein